MEKFEVKLTNKLTGKPITLEVYGKASQAEAESHAADVMPYWNVVSAAAKFPEPEPDKA